MRRNRVLLALALVSFLSLPRPSRSSTFKVLHSFGGTGDGSIPYGPLVLDAQGDVYGVTIDGGAIQCTDYGCGTVFALSPEPDGEWAEKILYDFTGGSNGAFPWGGLLLDGGDKIFGTIQGYGSFAVGGAFELTFGDSSNYSILYSNGAGPGLLMDNLGNLYGQTGPGEHVYNPAALGKLSPNPGGWTYTPLYQFCNQYGCPDGYSLPAPPIWDGKGNMYGVTTDGGIGLPECFNYAGCGVIFRMVPSSATTWDYQVLHRFASSPWDGEWPYGGLVMDAAGNFYGSTWLGGPFNHGTVFKFRSPGWDASGETLLYDFPNCLEGCMVEGTLAMDQAGNLYGTAAGGTGSCGGAACGVVFELSPQPNGKWKYAVLHDFTAADGGVQPFYGVILDDGGDLFGVTSGFGKYGGGTVFEITP